VNIDDESDASPYSDVIKKIYYTSKRNTIEYQEMK
jgi:hypothetical protein